MEFKDENKVSARKLRSIRRRTKEDIPNLMKTRSQDRVTKKTINKKQETHVHKNRFMTPRKMRAAWRGNKTCILSFPDDKTPVSMVLMQFVSVKIENGGYRVVSSRMTRQRRDQPYADPYRPYPNRQRKCTPQPSMILIIATYHRGAFHQRSPAPRH